MLLHRPLLRDHPPMLVPSSALLYLQDGTKVAVVEDNKVKLKTIKIGRDLGAELEVVEGLTGDERVVANPGERLAEGVEVQVATPATAPPQPKTQTAARK